ncbi:nucleotidyltransferase domain-containing protein [Alkalicoccobacillus murimartini]|uniref:Nucleotidyltransferase n=1 Tax=Alkalicoccobacillus murimartini TaxID=171685 RepID=A0ABT9YBZ3_9BACI|nr:nucleotidyltransferase domain-containing protein [Alkalicoccobacillus murimartini]MDQ0205369.1 putative nucleotidyltransferase [Alkalicoccobacillus murimartini]
MMPSKIGTDSEGFIINPTSLKKVQSEFKPVITAIINVVNKVLKNNVHSMYLYGSVGRGEAKVGTSDMDVTVIVHSPLLTQERALLSAETDRAIDQLGKTITKVDYDIGTLEEALAPVYLYEWGFWLRHMCTCISGSDISQQFPKMKPTETISKALNRDFAGDLKQFKKELTDKDVFLSQVKKRSMVKRMIRGMYLTINTQDQSWSTKSMENLIILKGHFPDEEIFKELEELFEAEGDYPIESILAVLDHCLNWFHHRVYRLNVID